MSVYQLANGRWRAKVWHNGQSHSVGRVLGFPQGKTWPTDKAALKAEGQAKRVLETQSAESTVATVREFWEQWTTDPLFARPSGSTNIHNKERTKAFVDTYGSVALGNVGTVVPAWLKGGQHNGSVPALRAMFADAASGAAGCLIATNPFANLGIAKTKGRKNVQPPSQEQLEAMLISAGEITPPSFAAYLEFASVTAARPSELDALRRARVRLEDDEVDLFEQWNAKERKFKPPKTGPYTIALVPRARDLLLRMPLQEQRSPFVFETLRGTHYTPSARVHHWNRVRCSVGLPDMTLYTATRHYFGWYALNVLELAPHVIAEQFGHKDGGILIVQLYGHPDRKLARRKIREAFGSAGTVTPLHVVRNSA